MADAKPSLARDGTMQVTAKEGIEYLKKENKTVLLQAQGLVDQDAKSSVKEGERLMEDAGGKPDADAQTRGQQRKIEEIKNETTPESPAKKPKLAKDGTMITTAKEGKELLGKEKLGDTRQETAKQNASKVPTPKRGATIAKTVEEAKYVLKGEEINLNEGRRTRSQSKPASASPAKTPVKRAGTMQKTAKEGKEFIKRGKGPKGKGKSAPAASTDEAGDKAEEEEDEKEEETTEEKEADE